MDNDTISRKAAIDAIANARDITPADRIIAVDILDNLPSEPQWIPVTERLPEEGRKCICTVKSSLGNYIEMLCFGKSNWFEGIQFYCPDAEYGDVLYGDDVIAWMSLPEPYKEDE